jgi:hypothetical protein
VYAFSVRCPVSPGYGRGSLFPHPTLLLDVTRVRAEYDLGPDSNWDATWVTFAELSASPLLEGQLRFLHHHLGVTLLAVHAFMEVYEVNGFETRLVFWFTAV